MSETSPRKWRRGIGNESRKIWDERGRLVATVEAAEDGTDIVSAVNTFDQAKAALEELYALVRGECPSLLDEDSGGNARLDLAIEQVLKQMEGA